MGHWCTKFFPRTKCFHHKSNFKKLENGNRINSHWVNNRSRPRCCERVAKEPNNFRKTFTGLNIEHNALSIFGCINKFYFVRKMWAQLFHLFHRIRRIEVSKRIEAILSIAHCYSDSCSNFTLHREKKTAFDGMLAVHLP